MPAAESLVAAALLLSAGTAAGAAWYPYGDPQAGHRRDSLASVIPAPDGYKRVSFHDNSFPDWMRHLPVKPEGAEVRTWDGRKAPQTFYSVWRVIDLPLYFREDLEQCADWGFRFWYEYQSETGFGDELWLLDYGGGKKTWGRWKAGKSGAAPKRFFRWVCANANSHSQKQGLSAVASEKDLRPGDLLVQNEGGGIGHTSVVFDAAEDPSGKKVFLMGFGFMPAQEAHVERAPPGLGVGGWFTLPGYERFLAEHLPFGRPVLRSFEKRAPLALTGDPLADWDAYEKAVRDSALPVEEAAAMLPRVMKGLQDAYKPAAAPSGGAWTLPVEGGGLGDDFAPAARYGGSPIKGYSFFDGNRHGGHPAHDIFIRDRDQARAMLPGVVVSTFTGWRPGSRLRGGDYVWCYHPQEGLLSYYAHLGKVLVRPGQSVEAGGRLGTVGRTGLNAAKPGSPTHLHLMVLEYRDGGLVPLDYRGRLGGGR